MEEMDGIPVEMRRLDDDLDKGLETETEEDESDDESQRNLWPDRHEHRWWLAGVTRRYEELGLIQKSDQFDWSWHQEFDHEIESAQQRAESAKGPPGPDHEGAPAAGEAAGQDAGRSDAGSTAASSSAESSIGSGSEFGGDFGGFGNPSF